MQHDRASIANHARRNLDAWGMDAGPLRLVAAVGRRDEEEDRTMDNRRSEEGKMSPGATANERAGDGVTARILSRLREAGAVR